MKKDVILRTRDKETWRLPGDGDYARNGSGNKDKRKTKEEVDGRHERMDGIINRGEIRAAEDRRGWRRIIVYKATKTRAKDDERKNKTRDPSPPLVRFNARHAN